MKQADWKNKLKKACFDNSTYQDCFDTSLKVLAQILERRDDAYDWYKQLGGRTMYYDEDNKLQRNPALSVIESTEKDMLPYLRDLGLTPAGLKRIESNAIAPVQKKKDVFDDLLSEVTA